MLFAVGLVWELELNHRHLKQNVSKAEISKTTRKGKGGPPEMTPRTTPNQASPAAGTREETGEAALREWRQDLNVAQAPHF